MGLTMPNSSLQHKYVCIDPQNRKHFTSDLPQFCLVYKLNYSAMVNVANGYSSDHNGWDCLHYRDMISMRDK